MNNLISRPGRAKSSQRIFASLLIVGVSLLALSHGASAASATFVVTNTLDTGPGSFRQALIDANNNSNPADMDTITFAIGGSGVHKITPASPYPEITEKVTIDGYSQPGATPNTAHSPQPMNGTLLIEFDGVDTTLNNLAFNVTADDTVVRGINMHECSSGGSAPDCIKINADNVLIQGNYIGINIDGLTASAATPTTGTVVGVEVAGGTGIVIGGLAPESRNIMANTSFGSASIALNGGTASIYGNYVGIGKDGVTDLNGSGGIVVAGNGGSGVAQIGGATSSTSNVVSGASDSNMALLGQGSVVQGNYIGTDYRGKVNPSLTTGGVGISVGGGASGNLIGGINNGEGNIIAGIRGGAVAVARTQIPMYGVDLVSTKNAILGNSMHSMSLSTQFYGVNLKSGIAFVETLDNDGDIVPDVVTIVGGTNDPGDSDSGPNGLMNHPEVNAVTESGSKLNITYGLDTADSPVNQYRVEFFASTTGDVGSQGLGMGETFLGATTVSPGSNLSAELTLPIGFSMSGKALSATATAVDATTASGYGSTSRFSEPYALQTNNGTLASSGQNNLVLVLSALTITTGSVLAVSRSKRWKSFRQFS